jgi:glycosyltransferase involved in cell wall biosynthesis
MSARDIARPAEFLFVGRLVSSKGAELLLRAAGRLRERDLDFRIIFAGDGPERAALQVLARDFHLDSRVVFSGSLSDEDLNQALWKCDVLVAPSLAGEVFGLVVAQAMMRGKPVIVPVPSALAEVAGDAAFTFPIADDAALAGCIRRCIENPGEAAARGLSGRARSLAEYAAETMVAEHLTLYRQLAGNAQ